MKKYLSIIAFAMMMTSSAFAQKYVPIPTDEGEVINPVTDPVTIAPIGGAPNPLDPPSTIKGGDGGSIVPANPGPTPIAVIEVPAATTTGTCNSAKEGYTKVDKANLFYCDGTHWQIVLLESTGSTCTEAESGKNKISGNALLYCNGTNWLATGDKIISNCSQAQFGKMKFETGSSGTKAVQFCNGVNWLDTAKRENPIGGTLCSAVNTYAPVCSFEGVLYTNADYAKCAGAEVASSATIIDIKRGWCMPSNASHCTTQIVYFCGSDGVTYYGGGCGGTNAPKGVTLTPGECASAI